MHLLATEACRQVEVVALLQYVANQLKCCESLDLLLLKEMVQTMTVRPPTGYLNTIVLPQPAQQSMLLPMLGSISSVRTTAISHAMACRATRPCSRSANHSWMRWRAATRSLRWSSRR